MSTLSIIIPTLNEEKNLIKQKTNFKALLDDGNEIIVIDGGSSDHTLQIANNIGCKTIVTNPSRGMQLHNGAQQSKHEVLLFLHADTILPDNAIQLIQQAFNRDDNQWGRFNVSFANSSMIYKVIAWFMNVRSRISGIATGDQAIFVKRDCYFLSEGIPNFPLMEDIELSKRLKIFSKPACIKQTVIISSRKWETEGVLDTIVKMWCLRLLYFFGVSPNQLTKYYS